MSASAGVEEHLDAIEAQLEILAGIFERLLALRADLRRGSNAIAAARTEVEAMRRKPRHGVDEV